jgi:UDP-N-acetylglucosamine--N-acetylmuramyl-(pentapeptide) pyrophosphoryl-undecaprenol N-acetylglucosamine transferase
MEPTAMKKPLHIFFAGGGTGGHLYPAMAVAEQIQKLAPESQITFFCSSRAVDARVLSPTGYEFLPLPAEGFGFRPKQLIRFYAGLIKSYYFVKHILAAARENAVVIGTGGFVCAPVVFAARRLKIPVYLINVDIVPGKANRLLGRLSQKVFVQFEDTLRYFNAQKAAAVGCPLRSGFLAPDKNKAVAELGLDINKKTLLITGASSGSRDINNAIVSILPHLKRLASDWQIVHLTGQANFQEVVSQVKDSLVKYIPVEYYDDMPNLYAAADLIVGRSGAVSVAEYAASGRASICIPYPYHKDNHQFLNAEQLTRCGAAVVAAQDLKNPSRFAGCLQKTLVELMTNEARRNQTAQAATHCAKIDAAKTIAKTILQ